MNDSCLIGTENILEPAAPTIPRWERERMSLEHLQHLGEGNEMVGGQTEIANHDQDHHITMTEGEREQLHEMEIVLTEKSGGEWIRDRFTRIV